MAAAAFALVAVSELSEIRSAELFTPAHVFTILAGQSCQKEKNRSDTKPKRTDYEDSVEASSGNARTIRETLMALFKRVGCRSEGVGSAEAGLTKLQDHEFGVVYSDFNLPGMDGVAFLRGVVARNPNTIKVLISGYADNQMVSEARKLNIDVLLDKPFTLESLLGVLKEKVEGRKTCSDV